MPCEKRPEPSARRAPRDRPPRAPRPLDPARLDELALAYVARFATSTARLERYLRRKLAERGWSGEGEPPLAALIDRFARAGYLDDAAYARARAGSLLRRGFGSRRIEAALGADGIAAPLRAEVQADPRDERRAALALARKRRLGPFGAVPPADRAQREKQIAVLLRGGHRLDSARELVNAPSEAAAEAWAEAADDADR